jgi:starvation-inducible DNA-binding protein
MPQAKMQIEDGVIQRLQQQLANAFLLYANYKKYHWQSYGPLFRDLHLLFDEHAEAVLGTIDELGERVRILGGNPIADPRQFIEQGTVEVAAAGLDMRGMIEEALSNHARVVQGTRQAIYRADEVGDQVTADLLTRLMSIHEKQEWFLREILESDDGLIRPVKKIE